MKRNRIEISSPPQDHFSPDLFKEKEGEEGGVGGGSPPLPSPSLAETYSFLELSSAQRRIYTSFENVSFIAVLQFATLPAQGRNNFSRRLRGRGGGGRKGERFAIVYRRRPGIDGGCFIAWPKDSTVEHVSLSGSWNVEGSCIRIASRGRVLRELTINFRIS